MSAEHPPISGLGRGMRLGRAAVGAGVASVLDRLGPAASGSQGARPARIMMSALLELRGAALKVAQFFSLESDWLPEAAARELARACHRVPSMSQAFVRDAICRQLGSIDAHFASLDLVPFAAASLGQVHLATTKAGQAVAVKLQYPGMTEAVRSDMRLLRHAARLLPDRSHYLRLLDEVEARLLEECDYEREANTLAWFRERVAVEGVTVPAVERALSRARLLTTTRLPGLHLDDWLRTDPPQEARDSAAQRLYDTFMQCLHMHGRVHADPNPGNILFGQGGEVGLIDFGCTRWIDADFQDIVARLWRASVADDAAAGLALQRDAGMYAHLPAQDAERIDREILKPFRDWVALPFLVECFDFRAHPGFVAEGRRLFARCLEREALVGVRPEIILVNRTLYGLYRLFERLGARVRCQNAWTAA